MSTSTQQDLTTPEALAACSICENPRLETIVELPNLPLTGRYTDKRAETIPPGIDQRLLWCNRCGHAQLGVIAADADLYGAEYSFRTSESATARGRADVFFDALDEFAGTGNFETVIDVGCNDTYHLEHMEGRARRRIGVDPIWVGREHEAPDGIEIIGTVVEDSGLQTRLERPPDLIISTHTFEHIPDPVSVLETLFEIAGPDTLFMIETPGFDALVRRQRFDQVFHEHLQYYSEASYRHLLHRIGGELLGIRENYHHWGSLIVVFKKSASGSNPKPAENGIWTADDIRGQLQKFRRSCEATADALASLDGPVYGYGAAGLVPSLAYHMDSDLGNLEAILDDDAGKDGLYYPNLPSEIALPARYPNWREGTVLLTAIDNVQPIMKKLLDDRPRHIVYPLHIL